MLFQVLDVNYKVDFSGIPTVIIFGKSFDGQVSKIIVNGFRPYFYAKPKLGDLSPEELAEIINSEEIRYHVSVVEKFLPMFYQTQKSKVFKINYNNPQDTKQFREDLINRGYVDEVYEADILFKNRFMIDLGIVGMGYIDVPGLNIHYTDIKVVDDINSNNDYKIMAFDIECLPPAGGKMPVAEINPIIIISMSFYPPFYSESKLILTDKDYSETDLLIKFLDVIKKYDPDFLIGYNINEFDLPYLATRMAIKNVYPRFGRDESRIRIRDLRDRKDIYIPGRIVIDLLPLVRKHLNVTEYSELKFPMKSFSLKYISENFLDVKKLDVKPSEMRKLWLSNDKNDHMKMINYAFRDAELMINLYNKLQIVDKYIALSKASGILLQDAISSGQTAMIDSLILRKFRQFDRIVPMKSSFGFNMVAKDEKTYQGAIVLDPVVGLHEHICIMDYASLYPSIMRAYNLSPDTLYYEEHIPKFISKDVYVGIVPQILEELYNNRVKFKQEMKKTSDTSLKNNFNLKQYAMKILLNSIYGYFGFVGSRLYEVSIASRVTEEGRRALLLTKKIIENDFGCKVLSGDTDSVFIKSGLSNFTNVKEFANKISNKMQELLPYPMQLAFEAYGSVGLILAKKRYAINISEDGINFKLKYRGIEVRRRDWCAYTEETLSEVLEILLSTKNISMAAKLANARIIRLKSVINSNDQELMKKLILSKKISKGIDEYKSDTMHINALRKAYNRGDMSYNIGDRLDFYVVAPYNKEFVDVGYDTEHVTKNTEVVSYVIENNIPIDINYYLEKQLYGPLNRIFDVLNYDLKNMKFKTIQKNLLEW